MKTKLDTTPLCFGKYKGKTPLEVLGINPDYLVWMYKEVERFPTCSAELAFRALKEKEAKKHKGGKNEVNKNEKLLNQGIIMNPTYPISAEEAKLLGPYEAEWYSPSQRKWFGCGSLCKFKDPDTKYRLAPLDPADRRISSKQASKLPLTDIQVSVTGEIWNPPAPDHNFSENLEYRLKVRGIPPCNMDKPLFADLFVFAAFSDSEAKQPNPKSETHLQKGNAMFDSNIPVQTVTLIYGHDAKTFSDRQLMTTLRQLDADIATYTKEGAGSARMEAKVAEMKANRAAVIAAFDAANPVVGATSATTDANDSV